MAQDLEPALFLPSFLPLLVNVSSHFSHAGSMSQSVFVRGVKAKRSQAERERESESGENVGVWLSVGGKPDISDMTFGRR